jgi:hypothetical protein
MHAPGEQAQHANSVVDDDRLAEDGLIDYDYGVGPKYSILRSAPPDRQRLLTRQPLRTLTRRFTCERSLIDVRRLHGERNAGVA